MPRRLSFTRLSLQEQPLVYIALAFVFGEVIAAHLPNAPGAWLAAACVAWLLSLGCLCAQKMKRQREAATMVLLVGFCAGGAALWSLSEADIGEGRVRKMIEGGAITPAEPVELWGQLGAAPEPAPDRVYLSVVVERVATLGTEHTASGTVQLIVSSLNDDGSRDEYDALRLDYGSRVRVLTYLRNAHGYRNPGAVNFDQLLEYRGYDATGSVKSPLLIEKLGDAPPSRVLAFLYRLRAHGITALLRDFKQPASGVLVAALFGNQYFLSRETAENFRASGTFHLLVISGLHVAMIAALAFALVKLLTVWLWDSQALRCTVIIALLWCYALMVGAQPAVTRATVMLTVTLAARLIFRAASGANTVAASALALLVWNPKDYLNPSLQLSLATVMGTVVLAAPLLSRLQKVGAWRLTAMTPYPPRTFAWFRWVAEFLFWNEAEFRAELQRERIQYRLEKASAARQLSGFSVTRLLLETRVVRRLGRVPAIQRLSKSRVVQLWREKSARWLSGTGAGRVVQWCVAWAAAAIVTTTCVQFGLLPMMIANFHRVSLISPLANVIEGALMFALMAAGGAYLLLRAGALFLLPQAIAANFTLKLAAAVQRLGDITTHAADPLRRVPQASLRVPDFGEDSWLFYVVFFALLAGPVFALDAWNPFLLRRAHASTPAALPGRLTFTRLRQRRLGCTAVVVALVLLVVLAWLLVQHPCSHRYERGRLSVTFLDVGQGDAMLVSFPQGRLMLLDSGGQPSFKLAEEMGESLEVFSEDRPGVGETAVAPYLWRRGIKRLDAIAVSHAHPDHAEGFSDIVRDFEIGEALVGVVAPSDENFDRFKRVVEAVHIPLRSLARGRRFAWDGVQIEVLAPFADQLQALRSGNDESLVLRLGYGRRTFLLTGDIERKTEARLTAADGELRADVLKVAHHGSRTSSTREFLARVAPHYAVISVAAPSPFGHPHAETLERLREVNAQVLQTSACGAITVSTDGEDLRVETFVPCQ